MKDQQIELEKFRCYSIDGYPDMIGIAHKPNPNRLVKIFITATGDPENYIYGVYSNIDIENPDRFTCVGKYQKISKKHFMGRSSIHNRKIGNFVNLETKSKSKMVKAIIKSYFNELFIHYDF